MPQIVFPRPLVITSVCINLAAPPTSLVVDEPPFIQPAFRTCELALALPYISVNKPIENIGLIVILPLT